MDIDESSYSIKDIYKLFAQHSEGQCMCFLEMVLNTWLGLFELVSKKAAIIRQKLTIQTIYLKSLVKDFGIGAGQLS